MFKNSIYLEPHLEFGIYKDVISESPSESPKDMISLLLIKFPV